MLELNSWKKSHPGPYKTIRVGAYDFDAIDLDYIHQIPEIVYTEMQSYPGQRDYYVPIALVDKAINEINKRVKTESFFLLGARKM